VSGPDPGRVLRWALVGWGLGHLVLGRTTIGLALLAAELASLGLVAWLTIGLADTSAYLVPFIGGVAFLAGWAWQAVSAYRTARSAVQPDTPAPARSPALAIGWLSLPLLAWGTGFWLIAAHAATPAAVLDRFVTEWSDDALSADRWPAQVVAAADDVTASLGTDADRFRDVRVRIDEQASSRASAVAEAIHYERRASRFLWIFAGSELVPVADRELLWLELAARPAELPGGGEIGAVRWELIEARTP
jgi:hypothetical protein